MKFSTNINSQEFSRPQNFRSENSRGNQAKLPILQVSTCDSKMLGDLPEAEQLVWGRELRLELSLPIPRV